jgi:transcriptional regulator with XRE-family HTH domain
MPFHIGEIIKKLVKEQQLKTKDVANAINGSKQTVYKIYRRKIIDSERLTKLSVFLKVNLFSVFREQKLLTALPDPTVEILKKEVEQLRHDIVQKDKIIAQKETRIVELEEIKDILQGKKTKDTKVERPKQ